MMNMERILLALCQMVLVTNKSIQYRVVIRLLDTLFFALVNYV